MVYDHRLPRTRRFVDVVSGTYDMVAYRLLLCNTLKVINSPVLVILGLPQGQIAREGLAVFYPPR